MKRQILVLAALAVLGIALDALDLVDWLRALEWTRARAGGTAGALGAYLFARRLTRLDVSAARGHRLFNILERQGDFFTLCALRVLPGMPHSAINYASGTLALPLPRFLAATALGLALKSYLYSAALHIAATTGATGLSDLLRLDVLAPLLAIALLLLPGRFLRRR